MKAMYLVVMIISVAVLAVIFSVLTSEGLINITGQKESIEINSKESFQPGEKAVFEVKAKAASDIKKIIYVSPNKKEENICNNGKECSALFTETFEKAGALVIEIKAELQNGKELTEKKKIQIMETGKKCSDGTIFNSCSKEKPKYCNNGKIENNCEVCGCSQGECIGKECVYGSELEIQEIFLSQEFFKPSQQVNIIIKSEDIPEGKFEFTIEWKKGSEIEKTEEKTGEKNCTCKKTTLPIQVTAPEEEGNYEINLIYKEQVYSVEGITIRNDSTAPKPPNGVLAIKIDGKILIAWNPNTEDDLMQYKIYRSKENTNAFTTYVFAATAGKEETGKELEIWESNYFYLTAVDYFGNESAPTAIIEAQ